MCRKLLRKCMTSGKFCSGISMGMWDVCLSVILKAVFSGIYKYVLRLIIYLYLAVICSDFVVNP